MRRQLTCTLIAIFTLILLSLNSVSAATLSENILYITNASGIASGENATVQINLDNGFNPKAGSITFVVHYNETIIQVKSVAVTSGGVVPQNLSSPLRIAFATTNGVANGNAWLANITFMAKMSGSVSQLGLTLETLEDVALPPKDLISETSIYNGTFTTVFSVPVANFSATPTSGSFPLVVRFSDASIGCVTAWSWDFGDYSAPSTEKNPTHSYTNAGTFHVSLTVTGPGGSNQTIQANFVTVNLVTGSSLPLTNEKNGTVSGDLYVGSFQPVPFVNQPTSGVTSRDFDQPFTIPTFTNIQWARVYVNVYSGTGSGNWPTRTTTTLDANGDGTYETVLGVENMTTGTAYSTDGKVYWINDHTNRVYSDYETSYDVTSLITSSQPAVHVKNEKIGTGSYDGRLKAVTLIVAYNDGDSDTVKYWVNHGHDWINSGSSSTTFGTAGIPTGFTSATLSNVALSSVDGTYTFNSVSQAGANPVSPINYYENHTWSVTGAVNPAANSVFQYALGTGPSFKTTLATLAVRYPVQEQSDLQVTTLECNPGAGAFLFANELNVISITVKNNGTAAAGESTLIVDVAGALYYANVSALGAGANQTVTVSDTISRTNGTVVRINATAVGGKFRVSDQTVYNNGYKGKRWTGGSDMNTQVSYDGRYGITYSAGDTVYAGASWTTKTFNWSVTDLPIPAGATVASARLYQGYSYNKMTTAPAFTMAFNSNTVTPVATYLDRKSFGTYDYPYGLYVYDVTSQFNTAGNSITITPEAGNNYALYGAYLIVVYQDAGTTSKKIFVNDEFDMVWSRSAYSTNNEEATVYASFAGADTYNIAGAKAIAILASASDVNKSRFFWNGNEYTGFWSNYLSGPQIGFSPYDVTTALASGSNVARLQSYDTAGNGDNMYAMNTILVIESGSYQPTLNIPTNVTFNTMLTVPVQVEHLMNATGVSFDITYDPSVIQLNSVTVNQSAIGTNTLTTNLTPGRARIAVTGTDGITINNRAALFNLNITGVGVNKAETPMTVLNAHWSETSFDVHPLTAINGSIIIGVRGDFNGNGIVDIGDTARVAYMVAKLTPVDMAADFNFVGTVDIGDASKIACYLVGKVAAL